MKTSKIISISLLSIIALFILASALDIRINGHRNGDQHGIKVSRQVLPTITTLCINNSKSIEVLGNDSTYIKVSCPKDSLLSKELYTVKGDTLVLSDLKRYVKIKLYANSSLRNILLKKSNITIRSNVTSKISFDMDKSYVWIDQDENNKSSFKTLEIKAKNHSNVRSNFFKIDSLGVVLLNSHADLDLLARKLSGTLSDSSRLNIQQPEEIWMKQDTTSKVYFYD